MKFLEQLKQSLESFWQDVAIMLPKIVVAIIAILVALLVIKIVTGIVKKTLKLAKADKLDDRLNEIELFRDKKLNFNIIKIVVTIVRWMLYVMLLFVISDVLNFTSISDALKDLLGYLPRLFTAMVIFILGLLFANIVKKAVKSFFESMELSGSKIISQLVFILLLVFVSLTSLNQAGINTEIITSNVTMIMASFLFSFSIAFGLGARDVVGDLLRTFYTRKTFEVGKKIEYNGQIYEVEAIENISVILKKGNEKLIVPIKNIVESEIKVQDEP
jgi:hypothetical protein